MRVRPTCGASLAGVTVVAVPEPTRRLPLRLLALSTALALAASAGTYALLSDDSPSRPDERVPLVAEDPSAARFTSFDGDVVALSSLRGGPVLVNFFASTCTPCITEMPALEAVHKELGDQVTFLGLALQDRPEEALALVDRTGITYRTAQDKDASVITALGGTSLPTTVLARLRRQDRRPSRGPARCRWPAQAAAGQPRRWRVIDAPLAIAFGSGMLATVNPCGFAMLPAYLGYFLGIDAHDRDVRSSVARSLGVGLSVSAGFLIVFSVVGLAIYHVSASVDRWTPWATIVIGSGLVVLGIAMVRGFEPVVSLPKLNRGGRTRSGQSMFVFGVSYAIASISCALPLFTGAVAGTFRRENLVSSLAVFVAYSLGMTLVLLALTVSMGMARQSMVQWLRRALPFVTRVSGGVLVLAGAYLAHYGWYEMRVRAGKGGRSSAVDLVTGWSDSIARWVNDTGPTRVGLLLALALSATLTATFSLRTRRRS